MKSRDNKSFTILLAIVACLLTIINIKLFISKYTDTEETEKKENTVAVKRSDKKEKELLIQELKGLNERSRMERYFGIYIDYVESGEYEKAYNLLYPEFRDNYFESLDKFEEYVKEKYPEIIIIDYDNIERQGKYYVLSVKIPVSGRNGEVITQNVVVYEKGYADFNISFSL